MEGFKSLPKMAHFKEGGHAKKEMCGGGKTYKKGGEVCADDKKQDKAMIKKAFKQHDESEHDKEPTEIKLKKGGRSKKETGTVRKYKDGGGVYGAKKDSKDLKSIEAAKEAKPKMIKEGGRAGSDVAKEKSKPAGDKVAMIKVKPTGNKKADAPSKAADRPNFKGSDVKKTNKLKAGDVDAIKKVSTKTKEDKVPSAAGKGDNTVKKFAEGRLTGPMEPVDMERRKRLQAGMATLPPSMQQQLIQQMPPSQLQAAGIGMPGQLPQPQLPQTAPIPNPPMGQPRMGQ
jgi:hypothetical protein